MLLTERRKRRAKNRRLRDQDRHRRSKIQRKTRTKMLDQQPVTRVLLRSKAIAQVLRVALPTPTTKGLNLPNAVIAREDKKRISSLR